MTPLEILIVAVVGLAGAGALYWLTCPLCDALRWLSDPQDAQTPAAEDLRAAHDELVSRP